MIRAISILWRIVIAAIVAFAIVPLASNVAPDQDLDVPAEQVHALHERVSSHLSAASSRYRIPPPEVRFLFSSVAGVTQKVPTDANNKVQIRLGDTVRSEIFRANPDYVIAVASHEFGHAALIARGQEYPSWIILAMYAAGFFPLLVVFPMVRSILIAGVIVAILLAAYLMIPGRDIVHSAYTSVLYGILAAGLLLAFTGPPSKSGRRLMPESMTRFFPSPLHFGIAAAIGVASFSVAEHYAGRLNTSRELRADIIGACLTSPDTMRSTLLALRKDPDGPISDASDAFHPSMKARSDLMIKLHDQTTFKLVCSAMEKGAAPGNFAKLLGL